MENLRWILLAAGIFFILAIYVVGRQRRRRNSTDLFDSKQDLPDFTARDWDDLDEGVGEVRVIARDSVDDDFSIDNTSEQEIVEPETAEDQVDLKFNDDLVVSTDELDESIDEEVIDAPEAEASKVDIIVLYILAKPSELLLGDQINSAAQANGLVFGSMNIFHRVDDDGHTLFSLANMVEPGNFDPDTIHDMNTTGLTVFMQLSNLKNPADDFDEMLSCAYRISEMLDANLCNQSRQPITQEDAEYYRQLISEKESA